MRESLSASSARAILATSWIGAALVGCAPPAGDPEIVGAASTPVLTVIQEATLLPPSGEAGARFGVVGALTPTEAFLGAPGSPLGGQTGCVYPFVRDAEGWKRGPRIVGSDSQDGDWFGSAVAVDGDTLLVGAASAGDSQGAAYVFVREGESWTEQAKLLAAGGEPADLFARRVLLEGDVAILNAPRDEEAGLPMGSVRLFARSGSTWTEEARIDPPDNQPSTLFAGSIAKGGDLLLIGAVFGGPLAEGAVHVYTGGGVSWTYVATLSPPAGSTGDAFGESVATDGETIVVGAPRVATDGKKEAGAAYVFSRAGGAWDLVATLVSSAPEADDELGRHVALAGDLVLIGSQGDDVYGQDSGALFVFRKEGGSYLPAPPAIPAHRAPGDRFGSWAAAVGGEVLVGAPLADMPSNGSGAAYLFRIGADVGDPCADPTQCPSGGGGAGGATDTGARGGGGGASGEGAERSYYSCAAGGGDRSETGLFVAALGLSLRLLRRRRGSRQ